jgi:L-ascorbate metabolism protein UlaG (beta-lactamase superfamily)
MGIQEKLFKCTTKTAKIAEQRRVERRRKIRERVEKCRKGKWWNPKTWFCWIKTLVRTVVEYVWEIVWTVVRWIECVVICKSYFREYKPNVSLRPGELYQNNADLFASDCYGNWKVSPIPSLEATARENAKKLSIQFLGTNSIFISDNESSLLIDPYFTRPNIPSWRIFLVGFFDDFPKYLGLPLDDFCTEIKPNRKIIEATIKAAGIQKVDAILTTHSHYDHALDLAVVSDVLASQNSDQHPKIFGSSSIKNVCLGGGLSSQDIETVKVENTYYCGNFAVTFLKGKHLTMPIASKGAPPLDGHISKPITPPARLSDYRKGEIYNILIEHRYGTILNQGSANFSEDALDNYLDGEKVNYLLLGIAGMSSFLNKLFANRWKEEYYSEVVEATRPERVFLTHWDDFNRYLDNDPAWVVLDDPPATAKFLRDKDKKITFAFLPLWKKIDLWRDDCPDDVIVI